MFSRFRFMDFHRGDSEGEGAGPWKEEVQEDYGGDWK